MISSSWEVFFCKKCFLLENEVSWVGGGWLDQLKIRLISAETEAEALLGLAELGNIPENKLP